LTLRSGTRRFGTVVFLGFICGVVGAASAFLAATQLPHLYEAQVSLNAPTMADTFAELADSRSVLQGVVSLLNLSVTPEALAGRVNATPSRTSTLLTIVVNDSDAGQAAAIANAIAAELVRMAPSINGSSTDAQRSIQADLVTAQTEIARTEAAIAQASGITGQTPAQDAHLLTLQSQLATLLGIRSSLLTLQVSYSATVPTVIGSAEVPTKASSPEPPLAGAIGGLFGLTLGIGIGLLVTYMRRPGGQLGPPVLAASVGSPQDDLA
jgi:uncharacterized protein involved in exopolysaccharide biosynthesis